MFGQIVEYNDEIRAARDSSDAERREAVETSVGRTCKLTHEDGAGLGPNRHMPVKWDNQPGWLAALGLASDRAPKVATSRPRPRWPRDGARRAGCAGCRGALELVWGQRAGQGLVDHLDQPGHVVVEQVTSGVGEVSSPGFDGESVVWFPGLR
jgi:hypothetical protein